jgi:hypothetical protein
LITQLAGDPEPKLQKHKKNPYLLFFHFIFCYDCGDFAAIMDSRKMLELQAHYITSVTLRETTTVTAKCNGSNKEGLYIMGGTVKKSQAT